MKKQILGFVLILWGILIAVIEVGLKIGEFLLPLLLAVLGTLIIFFNRSDKNG